MSELASLILLGSFILVISLSLLMLLWQLGSKMIQSQTQTANQWSQLLEKVQTSHSEQLDKVVTMLGTKDPLAYQQVQSLNYAMSAAAESEPYDPSDEGEIERIRLRDGINERSGYEYDPELRDAFAEASATWPGN